MHIVYCAENSLNGKIYVGKTSVSLQLRWERHLKACVLKKVKYAFHRALRKYGSDKFALNIIAACSTNEEASEIEKQAIIGLSSHISAGGYNITWGGDGVGSGPQHPSFGKSVSEETRKKISDAQKGANNYSSRMKGPRHYNRGLVRSEETRAKIRAARKLQDMSYRIGKPVSEERRKRISETLKRVLATPEARAKISLSTRLGMQKPEVKAKLKAALARRKPPSLETRLKMSEGIKKAWADRKNKCL